MPMRENIYDATIHRPMLRIPPSNQKGVRPAIRYPALPFVCWPFSEGPPCLFTVVHYFSWKVG